MALLELRILKPLRFPIRFQCTWEKDCGGMVTFTERNFYYWLRLRRIEPEKHYRGLSRTCPNCGRGLAYDFLEHYE